MTFQPNMQTFSMSLPSRRNDQIGDIVAKLLSSKKLKKQGQLFGTSSMALALAACGSDSVTTTSSNLLTLTKSADTYSASAVTGFTISDSSTAKLDVADSSSNAYDTKLDATGTGVLEFNFADTNDTVTLAAGSKTSGFTTLKVTNGTLDATSADLTGITRVEVASGIKISLSQIKEIPTVVSNSATSEITVEVTSEAEATELVSLISAGTVSVFGDSNPIKLVAAPTATVATETLTAKQTETTASVKPSAEAPADTAVTETTVTDTVEVIDIDTTRVDKFELLLESGAQYLAGSQFGDITVTEADGVMTFTSATGGADTILAATLAAGSLVSNSVTLTADAVLADNSTMTGTSNVVVNALKGDEAADLSNITVTGTRTANVTDDVTFTGDLGTFSTVVADTKTLTAAGGVVSGKTITGAGNVAVSALTAASDLSNITNTGTRTADVTTGITFTGDLGTFSTSIASAEVLTAAAGKIDGKTIAGAGDLTVTSLVATTDVSNLAMTGTVTVSGVASAAQLAALDGITTNAIAATGITAISGTVAEASAILTAHTAGTVLVDADYTLDISGAATAAQLNALNTDTSGAVDIQDVTTITMANTGVTVDLSDSGFTDGTAAFTVTGGTGDDTITGGAGTDTIIGGAGSDTLDGDAGADTISFADVTAATAHSLTNVAGVAVNLTSSTILADTIKTAMGDTIVIGEGNGVAGGNLLTMDSAYLAATAGTSTTTMVRDDITNFEAVMGSALRDFIAVGATDSVNGGAGADHIIGGSGANTLLGGDGADVITGGADADTLTGGADADTFVYNTVDTSTASAMDTIKDYASASDILSFDTNGDGATNNDAALAGDETNEFSNGMATGTLATAIAADTSLSDATTAFLAAASFLNNDVAGFVYGGNTYVVHADDANAAGNIVELEGVVLVSLAENTTTDTFTGAIA